MQRALMLAIIQAYADHRRKDTDADAEKSFLFLIDEAELHLHPTAQRNLKQALFEICSRGDQVFVNTHSSVMITDNFEQQKIFKVEKIEKTTEITEVMKGIERQNIVYDLLGGLPTDLLLPLNFMIVEGESERIFLDIIMKRFYPDKPSLKVISASGFAAQAGRVVNAIDKIYQPLSSIYGDKVTILLDAPNATNLSEHQDFRKKYNEIVSSDRLFNLNVTSLEDYYPADVVGEHSKNDKRELARFVAQSISQEKFEENMPVIFDALKKAWEVSFGMQTESQII